MTALLVPASSAPQAATLIAACAARRARLLAQLPAGAIAVLATAPEVVRNADNEYPYRHDSDFYYLSGFTEPDSVLVLVAACAEHAAQVILFCRQKNPEREIWDGYRYGPEAARVAFGMDAAYAIEDLDGEMSRLLADAPALYYPLGGSLDAQVRVWRSALRARARAGVTPPASTVDLLPLLAELRLRKDAEELACMQCAADISAQAHLRAMLATRPGMYEYEVEAELLYTFRRSGAQSPAYNSIVASGERACVLHYSANNGICRDGELLLIDAGCEYNSYAADISRTYPVNGRFTDAQKRLYQLVLDAQAAALGAVAPGRPYTDMHQAAVKVLAQGMLDLGLLQPDVHGTLDDVIANQHHQKFYMHGTGHWLGLDVHDVGHYRDITAADKPSRPLQPGMTLTVEPGIYVRPAPDVPECYWNTGIRIEDDVLVTDNGYTILSAAAPKSVADIEHLMQQRPNP